MRPRPLSALPIVLTLCSCSDAPAPPAKGTPPFYWQAAQESFAAGDYRKTNDHLDQLVKTQSDFTERAKPWRLLMLSGMLKGNLEVADKFEYGTRQNKTNPTPFRKQLNDTRSVAANLSTQLLESWQKFKGGKPADITLDFPFPVGTAATIAALVQVSKGILVTPAEVESAQRLAVQRGVLLAVTKAVGAGDDTSRGREAFKARPAKVSTPVFMQAIAESLYEAATLFESRKLDRPNILKALCDEALETVKEAPDGKEKKELITKIEGALKKGKS